MNSSFSLRQAQANDTNTLLEIWKEAILEPTEIVTDVSKVKQWVNSAGPDRTKNAIALITKSVGLLWPLLTSVQFADQRYRRAYIFGPRWVR